ncbi:hypothetical protein ACFWTE_15510 [Nocardiopsis sp. NPDC058631]|uniref:hypothetical protein n=1 Tax=Nocardiopsis sp. NPDC058631 TaxID=3346566 RepID=UPI003664B30F
MGNTAKIIVAAIAGYILGRRRKFKLALTVAAYLGAKKLKLSPQKVFGDLRKEVAELPIVGELTEQSRDQLLTAAKSAVTTLVTKWAGDLAENLTDRTEQLRARAEDSAPEGSEEPEEEESEDSDEVAEADEAEEPEEPEEAEEAEEPAKPARQSTGRSRATTKRKRSSGVKRGEESE